MRPFLHIVSITRRTFLCGAVALAARAESRPLDPGRLAKFADPLPLPTLAKSLGRKPVPGQPGLDAPFFRIAMREFQSRLHRDLPATTMWGYDGMSPGPTIEARSGEGLLVEWVNNLPTRHLLPVDHHIHGAEADKPDVRAIVHVHGAKCPPESDGYPENWYIPGKSLTSYYPNRQDPATLWYHDHAMGITRLSMYAGLFGFFLLRDKAEDDLNLPSGPYEIPLTICDRSLLENGQLDYPISGIPGAPWVPEAPGEAFLLNGKIFPYLEVEPRRYRFRILNAANSRFFHLSLSNNRPFTLIGADQGLLPAPTEAKSVMIAPAERVDVVLDFSGQAGAQIVLHSDTFELMQFRVGRNRATDACFLTNKQRPVPRTP